MSAEAAKRPHQYAPPSWPAPIRGLAWLSHMMAVAEGIGIAVTLALVILLSTWQFLERNLHHAHLPFPSVPHWVDGVIRHSVFMLGFLGGAYATYAGRHIRIDAITRLLAPKRRMLLRAVTTAAAIGVVLMLSRAAWEFRGVALTEEGEASQVGQFFTSSRGAMIMVVGYLLIGFHFLVQLLLDAGWLISGKEPPPEWIAEASHGEADTPPDGPIDGPDFVPGGEA